MNSLLPEENVAKVGLIAVALSDDVLSNVGQGAWERSGGLEIEQALPAEEYVIVRPIVVHGGNRAEVEQLLRDWCDAPNASARCDLILTVGGDGLSPRDVIPDATEAVIERRCPGLAEHLRQHAAPNGAELAGEGGAAGDEPDSLAKSGAEPASLVLSAEGGERPFVPAALTRAVAGIRGQTLIINLPSCYRRPADALAVILPLLPEALAAVSSPRTKLTGEPTEASRPL